MLSRASEKAVTQLLYFPMISNRLLLFAAEPPSFTYTPADQRASAGRRLVVSCRAQGVPRPWLLWKRQDRELKADERSVARMSGVMTMTRHQTDSCAFAGSS